MAIATLAQYAAALKQRQHLNIGSSLNAPGVWLDGWAQANFPTGGAVSPGNTANGIVPTNATAGSLPITAFSGSGYITAVDLCEITGSAWVMLYDRLWHGGAYTNGTVTLTSQPSFSSRIPGGTDYTGLQLWAESSTSYNNSSCTATITYTDQDGNAGANTGAITLAFSGTNVLSVALQLPLAPGDSGLQKIESVAMTIVNGGINVMILRPLWAGYISVVPGERVFPLEEVGLRQVWSTSCINALKKTGASPVFVNADMLIEIASA